MCAASVGNIVDNTYLISFFGFRLYMDRLYEVDAPNVLTNMFMMYMNVMGFDCSGAPLDNEGEFVESTGRSSLFAPKNKKTVKDSNNYSELIEFIITVLGDGIEASMVSDGVYYYNLVSEEVYEERFITAGTFAGKGVTNFVF